MENAYVAELRKTAQQLDRWILETKQGGWSTQHVEAMQKRADDIWALIGRISCGGWRADEICVISSRTSCGG